MPLHRIYHPSNLFATEAERAALANSITNVYSNPPGRLPRFYVDVLFIPLESSHIYIGGQPRTNFVRITVEHIAIQLPRDLTEMGPFMERYEATLAPFIKDKGLDWEVSISSTPQETWRENGIRPPPVGSEVHELWVKENKPVPY